MLRKIIFLFFLFLATACSERIVHDVSEQKANRIVISLARSGIEANKIREGSLWSIKVSQSEATLALKYLQEARLLESETRKKQQSSSSFIQSNQERNRNLGNQIAIELENTLERFPQVAEAHVHLNLAGKKLLMSKEENKGSASVLLVSEIADKIESNDIQQIVAGAAGLEASDVSVVVVLPEKREWPTASVTKEQAPIQPLNQKTILGILAAIFGIFVFGFLLKKTNKEKLDFRSSLAEVAK